MELEMTLHAENEPATSIVAVGGMTCSNCEVLVERRLSSVPGVRSVTADHSAGTAAIRHDGPIDLESLGMAVADDGYTVSAQGATLARNRPRDFLEVAVAFALVLGVLLLVREYDLFPSGMSVPDSMGYGLVFVIGLVASVSSCIAVTGGLLVAMSAKYNEATHAAPGIRRFKPLVYFNVGRIVSYTLLGGIIGALGASLALSAEATGILTLVASAVMIVLGLQMLKLLPARVLPRMPKIFAHRIHKLASPEAKGGAFVLGALTFFLPCGFTQALQLYVLAKGSFTVGALTMLAFALGTLPALISLSALSSFAAGSFQRHFLKFAGAAVVVLGLVNIQYGLVLAGSGTKRPAAQDSEVAPVAATQLEGKQVVTMRVVDFTYSPAVFTVKQGIPVEWRIDASEAVGCGLVILAPALRIRQRLSSVSTTSIAFTPRETGEFQFNCGMGMMSPWESRFIVVPAG
jgi:sulfite exporter TauE/SafE/copper chaperone CopZ